MLGAKKLVSNLQTPTAHFYKCAVGVWIEVRDYQKVTDN